MRKQNPNKRPGRIGLVSTVLPIAFAAMLAEFLTGCVTSLPMQVQHLPEWDTMSVKKVAVMPFKDSDGSSFQKQIASDLTTRASQVVSGLSNFEAVSPEAIQGKRNSGQDISMDVDALFDGSVQSAAVKDTSKEEKYTETLKDGSKVQKQRTRYYRTVEIKFTYRLVRARDNSVIGQKSETYKGEANALSKDELPSKEELAAKNPAFASLHRILAPWQETIKVTLEKETSKDKAVKASMKQAEKAVKAGNLKEAQIIYSDVYNTSNSFAAGYNEAILTESLDGAQAAIPLMASLANESGNPKAKSALARMQGSVASAAAVADYQANQDSPLNKAIKEASKAIIGAASSKFPAGAKVAILKSSSAGQYADLLDYVVTSVTESVMSSSLTVVERGANAAAVTAEQDYQYSDAVREEDLVRVGQEYGAGVIIFLSITGSGSVRSLRVEAVSVETKEKLYTKAFEI